MAASRLGVGTAQFGMRYGVSNRGGQSSAEEAAAILRRAAEKGVRVVDTASAYGTSEAVIGRAAPDGFDIVTKTPSFGGAAITEAEMRALERAFAQSLERLKRQGIYGLLVHAPSDLRLPGGDKIVGKLTEFRSRGLVKKIGVSVYTPEEVESVLKSGWADLIQVPFNVLDQRLLAGGHLKRLKRAGVEVHARSVFLQGVLLMEPPALPAHFEGVRGHLAKYRAALRESGLSPAAAALGFVLGVPEIDVAICGAARPAEFEELLGIAEAGWTGGSFARFAMDDENVLNPSKWRL